MPQGLPHLVDNVSRHILSGNEPKVDFEKIFTKFSRAMGIFRFGFGLGGTKRLPLHLVFFQSQQLGKDAVEEH